VLAVGLIRYQVPRPAVLVAEEDGGTSEATSILGPGLLRPDLGYKRLRMLYETQQEGEVAIVTLVVAMRQPACCGLGDDGPKSLGLDSTADRPR